jgi:hypothetical protein
MVVGPAWGQDPQKLAAVVLLPQQNPERELTGWMERGGMARRSGSSGSTAAPLHCRWSDRQGLDGSLFYANPGCMPPKPSAGESPVTGGPGALRIPGAATRHSTQNA